MLVQPRGEVPAAASTVSGRQGSAVATGAPHADRMSSAASRTARLPSRNALATGPAHASGSRDSLATAASRVCADRCDSIATSAGTSSSASFADASARAAGSPAIAFSLHCASHSVSRAASAKPSHWSTMSPVGVSALSAGAAVTPNRCASDLAAVMSSLRHTHRDKHIPHRPLRKHVLLVKARRIVRNERIDKNRRAPPQSPPSSPPPRPSARRISLAPYSAGASAATVDSTAGAPAVDSIIRASDSASMVGAFDSTAGAASCAHAGRLPATSIANRNRPAYDFIIRPFRNAPSALVLLPLPTRDVHVGADFMSALARRPDLSGQPPSSHHYSS